MGRALEVVSGRATNPGATLTAATVNTGDSFTVKNFPDGANAWLVNAWEHAATPDSIRIRSSRLHDSSQAIRLEVGAEGRPLLPYGIRQRLYASDPLTVELAGGAAETDVVAFVNYYEDLPGIDARLHSPEDILPRVRHIHGVLNTLTSGATLGDYGGSQTIVADQDTLKADTDYAILGYLTDTATGIIGIQGPDIGNLRAGGPGTTDPDITSEWFVELSRLLGLPCIPVINSNNRGATLVDVSHRLGAIAIGVTIILGELV